MNQNLISQSPNKLQECETSFVIPHNYSTHKNFGKDLYNNVMKQTRKNIQKYDKIVMQNTNFNYELYRPKINLFGGFRQAYNTQLLTKQLDRLMEDECVLDKELSKINFTKHEDQLIRQQQTNNYVNGYSFLKNLWSRTQKNQEYNSTYEKMDEVNRKVVMLRSHIRHLAIKQNKFENTQLLNYVIQSKQYNQLKQRLQKVQAQSQVRQQQFNIKYAQLLKQMEKLREQSGSFQSKYNLEVEKLKKKDDQLLKITQKYHAIQLQLIKTQKECKKLSKQRSSSAIKNVAHSDDSSILQNFKQTQHNPQNLHQKFTFLNQKQGFYLSLQFCFNNIQTQNFFETSRSIKQIKEYMTNKSTNTKNQNTLSHTIQQLLTSKLVHGKQIPEKYSKNSILRMNENINLQHLDKLQRRQESRKKNNLLSDRINQLDFAHSRVRSELPLNTSMEKKKRFQRTKTFDQQNKY